MNEEVYLPCGCTCQSCGQSHLGRCRRCGTLCCWFCGTEAWTLPAIERALAEARARWPGAGAPAER